MELPTCEVCHLQFTKDASLAAHMADVHAEARTSGWQIKQLHKRGNHRGSKEMCCIICGLVFTDTKKLVRHYADLHPLRHRLRFNVQWMVEHFGLDDVSKYRVGDEEYG